jgi:hypothetical protein
MNYLNELPNEIFNKIIDMTEETREERYERIKKLIWEKQYDELKTLWDKHEKIIFNLCYDEKKAFKMSKKKETIYKNKKQYTAKKETNDYINLYIELMIENHNTNKYNSKKNDSEIIKIILEKLEFRINEKIES